MMHEIVFREPATNYNWGRNGIIHACGVVCSTIGDNVWLQPITSKGNVSDSVRLVVPRSEIHKLRDALDQIINNAD